MFPSQFAPNPPTLPAAFLAIRQCLMQSHFNIPPAGNPASSQCGPRAWTGIVYSAPADNGGQTSLPQGGPDPLLPQVAGQGRGPLPSTSVSSSFPCRSGRRGFCQLKLWVHFIRSAPFYCRALRFAAYQDANRFDFSDLGCTTFKRLPSTIGRVALIVSFSCSC